LEGDEDEESLSENEVENLINEIIGDNGEE
jgi:hypothetical protein